MKLAIFVFSDPATGGDESLGRLFNALALASESAGAGDDVSIVFAGAGTRWPAVLARPAHPARALYESVRPFVAGVSCACSEIFGARLEAESCGIPQLTEHALAGTSGLASARAYLAAGYTTLVF